MAEIIFRSPSPDPSLARQLIINGLDVSLDVYDDVELVKVGDDPATQEVGLRVTFALSTLNLNGNDATVTDHFDVVARQVAQKVTSE